MQGRLRLGVKLGNERFLACWPGWAIPRSVCAWFTLPGRRARVPRRRWRRAFLQAAGWKVGMYLSPYVYDVRERIQINGEMIPRADFARWVTTIRPHVEALEDTEHGPTTEFELKTAVGLCWLAEQSVDYAVLEVGLGGRLDATNVVSRPLVTVDHEYRPGPHRTAGGDAGRDRGGEGGHRQARHSLRHGRSRRRRGMGRDRADLRRTPCAADAGGCALPRTPRVSP